MEKPPNTFYFAVSVLFRRIFDTRKRFIKWRQFRWAYYRLIEKVDREIGKVLNVLHESDQYENTLIIFTSDHGDAHGAHKWNQKQVLYDESVRIPFIVSWKGKTRAGIIDR